MRTLLLVFVLAGNLFVQAQSSSTSPNPRDYVRITQWAHSNKFHLQWIETDKRLRATNQHARLYFDIESRRAQINGINFVLSLPVILRNKTVYISATDLQNTLHPVLFPVRNPTNTTIKTICLDPGHGGRDPGNLEGHMQENRYALLLAAEVERLLKESGFKVISTRQREGQTVELSDRPKIANHHGADLFVSLHYNSAANRNVQGAEVYCLAPAGTGSSNGDADKSPAAAHPAHAQNRKNILLAYLIQNAMVQNLKVEDRGVKRAQFMVLLNPNCPAVLIEAGFMSNSAEAKRISDPDYRKRMALAIVDGILAYKKVVER